MKRYKGILLDEDGCLVVSFETPLVNSVEDALVIARTLCKSYGAAIDTKLYYDLWDEYDA